MPVPAIEDPDGRNMNALYAKLARLLRHAATDHVRIGMYGDSNMTRDYITGEMRRTFQLRQGDGGHGFVSLGPTMTAEPTALSHWSYQASIS